MKLGGGRLQPWIRIAAWTAVLVLLLEAAWLATFEWLVRGGRLHGWMNRRPEKVQVGYRELSSLWPGLIEVEGLDIRGRTARDLEWRVEVEHARLQLSLLPLAGRRLIVRGAEATGVSVESHSARKGSDARSGGSGASGRSADELAAAGAALAAPLAIPAAAFDRRPSRWSFEFHRIRVAEVRRVVLDDNEVLGTVRGTLGFAVRISEGEAEILPTRLDLENVSIRRAGETIGEDVSGELEMSVAPYRYREERGRALLPRTSGWLRLSGSIEDGPILDELLLRAPWVEVESGPAPFDADLRFARGRLLAGSRFESQRSGERIEALDFAIVGRNRLALAVERDGSVDRARWEFSFDRFTFHRAGIEAPLLVGSGLALVGEIRPPDLSNLAEQAELRLELGQAELPDLAFLTEWLPAGARLDRLAGTARVTGAIATNLRDLRPTGAIDARFDHLGLRYAEMEVSGRAEVSLKISGGDLAARRLELAGTRVLLADFSSPSLGEPGAAPQKWWMQLGVDSGAIALGPPFAVESRFQMRLRDTAPLVALFETRRDLPKWAEKLLTEEDVRATGSLAAGPGRIELERFDTDLLGAKLSMRLRFSGAERRGKLLLAWRRLALGAGFDGTKRAVRIYDAREWFDSDR